MRDFDEFIDEVVESKKLDERYEDIEWEERVDKDLQKYPIIKRYVKPKDDLQKLNDTIEKEDDNKMTSLKETAKAYEPKTTMNIADLEKVDISLEVEDRTGTDAEGKEFAYKVLVVEGKEYRTPNTVLEEIKKIVSLKPDVKFVKVLKQGAGLNTRYSVEVRE